MNIKTLRDYITENYAGNISAFAKVVGYSPQHISQLIKRRQHYVDLNTDRVILIRNAFPLYQLKGDSDD